MNIRIKTGLAGLAVLALAACGSGTSDAPGNSDSMGTDTSSSSAPIETAEPTETENNEPSEPTSDEPSDAASEATAEDADLANVTFQTDAQAAIDKSTDEVGEGTVHAIEIEWDEDYSAWVWSVKTLVDTTDNKVKINADTGEILKQESEDTDDKEEAIDLSSPLTLEEAQQKALDEQDGAIRSWKLEFDDGRREYQFDIGDLDDTTEVTVDVESGEVTLD